MAYDVLVVGSANCDLVTELERRPGAGETVLGGDVARRPGGKGANQAWSAGRSGASVGFLACVGDDDAGRLVLDSLAGAGVDVGGVRRVERPTGTALILITPDGENSIVVCPGANAALTPEVVAGSREVAEARVVVAQLEVPLESVAALAGAVRDAGSRLVLNAAPSAELPAEVLAVCDPLVVNESEAVDVAGRSGTPEELAAALLALGPRSVVITLGAEGSLVADASGTRRVAAEPVEVVDTTGAGDAFVGALAGALAQGADLPAAAGAGARAAAYVVGRRGAQPA